MVAKDDGVLAMLWIWLAVVVWVRCQAWRHQGVARGRRRAAVTATTGPAFRPSLHQRKPDWVRREVIRLRACSPDFGCRKIADVFNRQFAVSKRMAVSKSYVANVLRASRAEIAHLR